MITIQIGKAFDPKELVISPDRTVKEAFRDANINIPIGAIIMLNARRLGDAELEQSLSSLHISDGDMLTITEKLNSAKN